MGLDTGVSFICCYSTYFTLLTMDFMELRRHDLVPLRVRRRRWTTSIVFFRCR